jgi:hypothetical protein
VGVFEGDKIMVNLIAFETEIELCELIDDYNLPGHWLMMQMNNYCIGANYVFFNGKHYYTVHHA